MPLISGMVKLCYGLNKARLAFPTLNSQYLVQNACYELVMENITTFRSSEYKALAHQGTICMDNFPSELQGCLVPSQVGAFSRGHEPETLRSKCNVEIN